jgi:hypothetical protein
MMRKECDSKIRYTLTDESGHLCFKAFDMFGAMSGCGRVLEKHLVGRPLSAIDPRELLRFKDDAPRPCLASVIRMIRENQRLFAQGQIQRKAI